MRRDSAESVKSSLVRDQNQAFSTHEEDLQKSGSIAVQPTYVANAFGIPLSKFSTYPIFQNWVHLVFLHSCEEFSLVNKKY